MVICVVAVVSQVAARAFSMLGTNTALLAPDLSLIPCQGNFKHLLHGYDQQIECDDAQIVKPLTLHYICHLSREYCTMHQKKNICQICNCKCTAIVSQLLGCCYLVAMVCMCGKVYIVSFFGCFHSPVISVVPNSVVICGNYFWS